jgi:hypothetical protein
MTLTDEEIDKFSKRLRLDDPRIRAWRMCVEDAPNATPECDEERSAIKGLVEWVKEDPGIEHCLLALIQCNNVPMVQLAAIAHILSIRRILNDRCRRALDRDPESYIE